MRGVHELATETLLLTTPHRALTSTITTLKISTTNSQNTYLDIYLLIVENNYCLQLIKLSYDVVVALLVWGSPFNEGRNSILLGQELGPKLNKYKLLD
jgi:hypothetical protein